MDWKDLVTAMLARVPRLAERGFDVHRLLDTAEAVVFEESPEDYDASDWYELISTLRRQFAK